MRLPVTGEGNEGGERERDRSIKEHGDISHVTEEAILKLGLLAPNDTV